MSKQNFFGEPSITELLEWSIDEINKAIDKNEHINNELERESMRCFILCAISYLNDANQKIIKKGK